MAKSTKTSRSFRAKTMEELLKLPQFKIINLQEGQEVEGQVINKTANTVLIEIGAKSEGLVVDEEFEEAKDFIQTLKPGDKVKAEVIAPENQEGQILLSLRKQALDFAWRTVEKAYKKGKEIEVKVEAATKIGLTVSYLGIKGFIPNSHLSTKLAQNTYSVIGKTLKVKIIEQDRSRSRLILSEKAVTEKEVLERQEKVLKSIKEGERLKGTVERLTNFGAFVKIKKRGVVLDGLIHLSELSWKKIANPADVVKEGEEIEVVVIGKEDGRLALSLKRTQKDPWEDVEKKYQKDMQVKGTVVRVGDFGAIVELEPGIEGLLPLAKIPTDTKVEEGEEGSFFIENIDSENRKITLALSITKKPLIYK